MVVQFFYVNEIQKRVSLECTVVQYADVFMRFASSLTSNDALNQLQNSLLELTKMFAENQLNLNASKSQFIIYFSKKINRM